MEGEKRTGLRNIEEGTTAELLQMLRRHEVLLNNKNLLRKLPDGGKKVKTVVETVRQFLSKRQQAGQEHADHLSLLPGKSAVQEDTHCVSATDREMADIDTLGDDIVGNASATTHLDNIKMGPESEGKHQGKITSKGEETCNSLEQLDERLGNLKISESKTELERPNRLPNSYEQVIKENSGRRSCTAQFKTNRTLVTRKLPEKHKVEAGGIVVLQKTKMTGTESVKLDCLEKNKQKNSAKHEVSAARNPAYSFLGGAKGISLEMSLLLQVQQKVNKQKLLSAFAEERLREKLGMKTVHYSPAEPDMNYRCNDLNMADDDDDGYADSDDDSCDDIDEKIERDDYGESIFYA